MTNPSLHCSISLIDQSLRRTCSDIKESVIENLKKEAVKIATEEAKGFHSTVTSVATEIIKKGMNEYQKQIEEEFKEIPDYASHDEGKWMFSDFKKNSLPIIINNTKDEFRRSLANEIKSIIKPILIKPQDSSSPTITYIKV